MERGERGERGANAHPTEIQLQDTIDRTLLASQPHLLPSYANEPDDAAKQEGRRGKLGSDAFKGLKRVGI